MAATATATAATVHSSTTTFVEADPSSFRAIVQKLTGAPNAPSASFRLQERRRSSKKLELDLNGGDALTGIGIGIEMVSPVSTLDFVARGNPCEEEEKAIAGKGFYLHPSPISPPGGSQPPRLLPLFPLSSPRDCNFRNHSVSS